MKNRSSRRHSAEFRSRMGRAEASPPGSVPGDRARRPVGQPTGRKGPEPGGRNRSSLPAARPAPERDIPVADGRLRSVIFPGCRAAPFRRAAPGVRSGRSAPSAGCGGPVRPPPRRRARLSAAREPTPGRSPDRSSGPIIAPRCPRGGGQPTARARGRAGKSRETPPPVREATPAGRGDRRGVEGSGIAARGESAKNEGAEVEGPRSRRPAGSGVSDRQ